MVSFRVRFWRTMSKRTCHSLLLVLLVAGLLIRLGWGLSRPTAIDQRLPDQFEYLSIARNLLAGQGFQFYDHRFDDVVYAQRSPGYPVFLALCGGSVTTARVAQAFIDASVVLAAFLLARRWVEPSFSLLAAALVAFNPFLIYFSALILSETLYVAMFAWGMVLLVYRRNFIWGGILLALSVLVRPAGVALPVALGLSAVFVNPPAPQTPRSWLRIPVGLSMLLLILLVLFPWAVRNRLVLGEWIWLTTNGGITRYDGFNPAATGASNQQFAQSAELRVTRRMDEVQRNIYYNELASDYIRQTWRENPKRLVRLTFAKIIRTWSPIPLSREFGGSLDYVLIAAIFSIPLYGLAVLGMWGSTLPRSAKLFLLMPALYVTLVHASSVGSLRYRMPAEPLLAVLAAVGVSLLWQRLRRVEKDDTARSS